MSHKQTRTVFQRKQRTKYYNARAIAKVKQAMSTPPAPKFDLDKWDANRPLVRQMLGEI